MLHGSVSSAGLAPMTSWQIGAATPMGITGLAGAARRAAGNTEAPENAEVAETRSSGPDGDLTEHRIFGPTHLCRPGGCLRRRTGAPRDLLLGGLCALCALRGLSVEAAVQTHTGSAVHAPLTDCRHDHLGMKNQAPEPGSALTGKPFASAEGRKAWIMSPNNELTILSGSTWSAQALAAPGSPAPPCLA
jgi:hypothetical protein